MTLEGFRQALMEALARHLPGSSVTMTESRGITLICRAELDTDTFIAIYFNALTGKTSHALVHHSERVAGFDNYRLWHCHPMGRTGQHVPCSEPTPDEAIAELATVSAKLHLAPENERRES